MKAFVPIIIVVAALAAVPLFVHSNVVLNFLVVTLLIALAGQGWNILGGYGGQYSFGQAAFFGTGAYATAILQVHYGVNAWIAFAAGIVAGAAVGAVIGALTFRAGLRSSYFALVTLAFAEVLRILASVAPMTGAGVGLLVKLDLRAQAFQFQSRTIFYLIILALVAVSLVIAQLLERSRFGAWLIAVRENEDAAMALGVDAFAVKLAAMVVSAAITAAAGCFYVQYFLFIDSGIAYGTWISIEALLTPIIGGAGTVFGALAGALVVRVLGEGIKLVTGDVPGLDLMIYGAVLVLVIRFARADWSVPSPISAHMSPAAPSRARRSGRGPVAEPLLSVEGVSRRFGGLLAVNAASLSADAARITALIGPNGAGKTTLFSVISGFLKPSAGKVRYAGDDVTGEPPHRLARRGVARTFQIVQPFAGLSVRDNILVGAHLHHPARAAALELAEQVGREVGLGDMLERPAHALTVAGRKRLELARALATEPKLVLLDEVLAGLNPSEIRDIVPVIRALSARGIAVLMIEHVMQAVMSLAEHVFVLAEGRIIAQGGPAQVVADPIVVEAYLGHGAAARVGGGHVH
jgi:ABC-type branched-subunit amino acid transport system ATPase component/ABC-type branched-subunit amino acid transport system permease subunit